MRLASFAPLAVGVVLAACTPLEPDPVIKDGVDLGPIQSFEAERAHLSAGMGNISDSNAGDTHALVLYSDVTATVPLELLIDVSGFLVRARGDQCNGAPVLEMSVDGVVRLKVEVKATRWTDYPALAHLGPGMHKFDFHFANDKFEGPKCDRNLYIDKVTFINSRSLPKKTLLAATMLAPVGAHTLDDDKVPGGKALGLMSEGVASGQVTTDAAAGLSIRARGDQCKGPPEITLSVDGVDRGWFQVPSTTWADYAAPVPLEAGDHTVSIAFINDRWDGCDRNIYLASVTTLAVAPPPVPIEPPPPPPNDGGSAGDAGAGPAPSDGGTAPARPTPVLTPPHPLPGRVALPPHAVAPQVVSPNGR